MKKKIPDFPTIEEARAFWEEHDFAEYAEDTKPADIEFARPKKTQVTFRLDPADAKRLKEIAESKGLSYTALVRMWVKEKLVG